MKFIICDVETIAHEDAASWQEPIKPAANLKDPAKVAASIAERTAERDEKLGLDPDCNRIVALGYVVVGSNDPVCLICRDEAAEAAALTQFWAEYAAPVGQQETRLVTYFGHGFDAPVLMRRSLLLSVKYPALNIDRYRSPHLDLCHILSFNGALKPKSLKFYAKRFGLTTLDKVDGADVAKLAAAGDWDAIRDHCLSDIGLTHALANRLGLLRI